MDLIELQLIFGGKEGMKNKVCVFKENGGLGSRDSGKFNISLLAKQGWRLIRNPKSLLAKVLQAKYFPQSNFMNSTLKSGSSYTWKAFGWPKKCCRMEFVGRLEWGTKFPYGTMRGCQAQLIIS